MIYPLKSIYPFKSLYKYEHYSDKYLEYKEEIDRDNKVAIRNGLLFRERLF